MALSEYYDDSETIPTEKRKKLQDEKLRQAVLYAYEHSPAARKLLDGAGVKPSEIKEAADLQKLPVTRKNDVIEMQAKDPPYGGLLAIPPEDVERIFISPGPVYEPLHSSSIEWFARSFWAAGFRKGDIVVNTFTYHLSPAGILFHEAIRSCGATVVPTGTGRTEIQVKTMADLKASGFVGTPSFLMAVIKKAEELGYDFKKDLDIKKAWFTGEPLFPDLRRIFEEEYGIETTMAYAVTEPGGALAYECRQKSGLHLMDEYIIEIVDPETGKQLKAGEVGEIVVTPIHNKSWGLIRFGTGDLSALKLEACPCGRTSVKLKGILGRSGDAVKVRGIFVVPGQVKAVFGAFKEVGRFQIAVDRQAQRDEMTFYLELADEKVDREKLKRDISERFQSVCAVRADHFEFVPKGAIPEDARVIEDRRKW